MGGVGEGRLIGLKSSEAKDGKGPRDDLRMEEDDAETEASPADLKRVLELLGRWALGCGGRG
jgi:hypothetical protein